MTDGQLNGQHQGEERIGPITDRSDTLLRCIFTLLLVGIAIPAQGATYYLNTTSGNASNPGTSGQPWKTLDQVQSKAAAGDIVMIQQADAATCAAAWPSHVSYKAQALQQFGITWQFDNYYTVGQFANRDFWVVGPVKIVTLDPKSTSDAGHIRHGSMVNPSSTKGTQGYDSDILFNTYDPALNVAFNVSAQNPLTLAAHSSLVSTISIQERTERDEPQIQRAAILTVLPSAAPAGSFRPAYCGTDKTVRLNKSMLNYSVLKRLPAVSDTPSITSFQEGFAAPWIDHQPGWTGRYQHPKMNMPAYGREMHYRIGLGALLLHMDYEPAQKETLMIRYVQLGIDLYGVVAAGGLTNWSNDGGHAGGRKWPILFAGIVLNDPAMKSIGQKSGDYLYQNGYGPGNCPLDYVHFGEDDQTFHVSEADVAITNGPTYPATSEDDPKIPYSQSDIGLPEWGLRHATAPHLSSKSLWTVYRNVACPPFETTALAALLTEGGKELWNHDAYFDYVDRYVALTGPGGEFEGWWSGLGKYARNMWDKYRAQCGPIWPNNQTSGAPVLSLIGSKQVEAGQTLTFTVTATDSHGDTLTYSATGLPAGATFANRVFTWTPASGNAGSHQVTFTVSDGQAQDSETITITVSQPNAAPILGSISNKSTNENQALSFSVSATDADGDSLTYSATGLPSGATFNGQTFTWTPGFTQAGVYNVTFAVSDGHVQDSQTVAISVANVNRAPVLAAIGDRSVDEDNTLALALSGADPDGTALTYSATGLPSGASFTGQNFSWTPTADQAGPHQITFAVSDGATTDSETITVTVVSLSADATAPVLARQSPAPGAIQVPLNNLITFHLTDAGKGVNAGSVTITLDGQIIYQGNTAAYTSAFGKCIRSGVKNDYEFVYQNNTLFDFDHEVLLTVNATDLAGNAMSPATYSFATEMRAFGSNRLVSTPGAAAKGGPVTVGDAAGNIWAAWHAGPVNARDIYVAKLTAGQESFGTPVQITSHPLDQCNPDLALAANGAVYVVWQDNRKGHWDIFASVSSNGQAFSKEIAVADANDNQTAPTVAVDSGSPSRAYVAWQDDRNGNQDIYVASSTNAFASSTVSRVTTNAADQTEPDLAIGAANTVYLVWTDKRSGQADLYAAASTASWTNVALVTGAGDQTSPAIAVTPGSSTVHLLWVSSVSGNADVYYASSNGLPASPLTGVNLIDDTSGASQTVPAIACSADGRIFACWQDTRNVGLYGTDTDVYFVDLSPGSLRTNTLVSEGAAKANQTEPAIALSTGSQPYIVWTDNRNTVTEIYCAATTYLDSTPLYATLINAATGATVGIAPTAITSPSDVSIVVPAGACQDNVRVTISRILNPAISPAACLGSYDFGPSGIEFDEPVTVTIPYRVTGASSQARAYWYNSLTGALSQQGMTEIENVTLGGNLYALRFKTTHFTPYYLVAGDSEIAAAGTDGGGGGGCSMSATGDGSPKHLLVPYAIVVVFMVILRLRDRKRATQHIES
jgi:PKD repeat protein